MSCATGTLGVWGSGRACAGPFFGPCVRGALPLRDARSTSGPCDGCDQPRFLRDVYAEMAPSLDVAHARITRADAAVGNVLGYAPRVAAAAGFRDGRSSSLLLPRVPSGDPPGGAAFYVSRTRAGWLVWRRVADRAERRRTARELGLDRVRQLRRLAPVRPASPRKATRPSRPIRTRRSGQPP